MTTSQFVYASSAQRRIWFFGEMHPGSAFYHMVRAYALEGDLKVDALARAFEAVCARHDALRTTFRFADGQLVQIIGGARPVLRVLDPPDRQPLRGQNLDRMLEREARTPFDLTDEAPIRLTLYCAGGGYHVLLLTIHHIAADGWSLGIFLSELSALYAAECGNGIAKAGRDERPPQYVDFTVLERQWLRSDSRRAHAEYWRLALSGAPAPGSPHSPYEAGNPLDRRAAPCVSPPVRTHRRCRHGWTTPSLHALHGAVGDVQGVTP